MSKRKRRERGDGQKHVEETRGFFDRRGNVIVWSMMGLYAAVFITFSLIKWSYFLYNDFDLAIFSQAAWTTVRGSMHSSILGLNYLGSHMSLTMPLLSPIYFVFSHPVTLLIIQSVVLALGALPVYWLARRELKNGFIAVGFAALYLLYPAIGYTNLYEFHPVTLATTTLLFAFYYLWVGRFRMMLLFALLSLMAKENVAVVVFMMGLYALCIRRPRRWIYSATLVGLSVLFLAVSFGVVMPRLNRGQVQYESFYSEWGGSMGEAVKNMATSPVKLAKAFFYTTYDGPDDKEKTSRVRTRQQYYVHLLVPLMLLSLASPLTLLIAAPAVAQHLLSVRTSEHTIVFQYTALVTPFVMVSAVLGLRNVLRLLVRGTPMGLTGETMNRMSPPRTLGILMMTVTLAAAVTCNILFGPIVGLGKYQEEKPQERKWPDRDTRALAPHMAKMADRIPDEGPVATGFRFMARAADRHELHSLHHIFKGKHTYSLRDYPVPDDLVAVAVDTADWRYLSFTRMNGGMRLREMVEKSGLEVVDAAGAAVLLLRASGASSDPFARLFTVGDFTPGETRFQAAYNGQLAFVGFDPLPVSAKADTLLPINTCWRRIDTAALATAAEAQALPTIRECIEQLWSTPDDTDENKRKREEWQKKLEEATGRAGITNERLRQLLPGGGGPPYYLIEIVLRDQFAQPASVLVRHLGYTFYPVHDWTPGRTVRETSYVVLPASLETGTYTLWLRVRGTARTGYGTPIPPEGDSLRKTSGMVPLGEVRIEGK